MAFRIPPQILRTCTCTIYCAINFGRIFCTSYYKTVKIIRDCNKLLLLRILEGRSGIKYHVMGGNSLQFIFNWPIILRIVVNLTPSFLPHSILLIVA